MNTLDCRAATYADVSDIYRMGVETFQQHHQYEWGFEKQFLLDLLDSEAERGSTDVAEIGGRMVGFLISAIYRPEHEEPSCRFLWFFVVPEWRGLGVSAALLHYSMRKYENRLGIRKFSAALWVGDSATARLVAGFGFRRTTSLAVWAKS